MNNFPFQRSLALLILGLAPTLMTLAHAEDETADAMQIEVRYDDLELSTMEGRAELERRIHLAAENVCSSDIDSQAAASRAYRGCIRVAEANALSQVDTSDELDEITMTSFTRKCMPPHKPAHCRWVKE